NRRTDSEYVVWKNAYFPSLPSPAGTSPVWSHSDPLSETPPAPPPAGFHNCYKWQYCGDYPCSPHTEDSSSSVYPAPDWKNHFPLSRCSTLYLKSAAC